MSEYKRITQSFEPIFDMNSKILILGSLPSVKSREEGFYYGNPQNRFWLVLSFIYNLEVPRTIDEKIKILINNNIALWDVIESCDIIGSSDSSIKNIIPADLDKIFSNTNIQSIYANGKKASKLYKKYCEKNTGKEIIELPSTSPANAIYTLDKLLEAWKVIKICSPLK